jgi:hypothetical protein
VPQNRQTRQTRGDRPRFERLRPGLSEHFEDTVTHIALQQQVVSNAAVVGSWDEGRVSCVNVQRALSRCEQASVLLHARGNVRSVQAGANWELVGHGGFDESRPGTSIQANPAQTTAQESTNPATN